MSVAESALELERKLVAPPPGLGLSTRVHVDPSPCMIMARWRNPCEVTRDPTAHMSVADTAVTAFSAV
jgi:hypothetical protein